MARSKKTKAKLTRANKSETKKTSGLLKILEVVVIIGTIAGVLINFFRGSKKKK